MTSSQQTSFRQISVHTRPRHKPRGVLAKMKEIKSCPADRPELTVALCRLP